MSTGKNEMVFKTFLNYWKLRTGCIVVGVLHLMLICSCLEDLEIVAIKSAMQSSVFICLVIVEKLVEVAMACILIYGAIMGIRVLLMTWLLAISPIFVLSTFYCFYRAFTLYEVRFIFFLIYNMFLLTYSLVLVKSHYEELTLPESTDCVKESEKSQPETILKSSVSC